MKLDINNYYGSISKAILDETIAWASSIVDIDEKTKKILYHVWRCFLFHQNEPWVKKDNPEFDVPQGAFDSAEVSDLCGLYVLHKLREELRGIPISAGLYRDDMLLLSGLNAQHNERLRKGLHDFFRGLGFGIKLEVNKKIVDFLDVTLNLTTGEYKEYRKPHSRPVYVNRLSNHPPAVIKNIPKNVNDRLNVLSSNEKMFNESKPKYQEALKASRYSYDLKYEKKDIR